MTFHTNLLRILISTKLLRIRFDKVDGLIRVYDGIRYLVWFGPEKYDAIYDKIRYLTSKKSGITYIISHNFPRLKIEKQGYCGLLLYWLSEFLIKVKITIFMIHF